MIKPLHTNIGVEHLICGAIVDHCINIVAAAVLQLVCNEMIQFPSTLRPLYLRYDMINAGVLLFCSCVGKKCFICSVIWFKANNYAFDDTFILA